MNIWTWYEAVLGIKKWFWKNYSLTISYNYGFKNLSYFVEIAKVLNEKIVKRVIHGFEDYLMIYFYNLINAKSELFVWLILKKMRIKSGNIEKKEIK